MRYRLLATDYDFTFTRSDHTVSERTLAAVQRAEKAGIRVSLATGRLPQGAAAPLRHFSPDTPAILCNGAILCRSGAKEHLWETTIEPASVVPLAEWITRQENGGFLAWSRSGLYTDRLSIYARRYAEVVGCEPKLLTSPEQLAEDGVYKMLYTALPEDVQRVRALFREERCAAVDYFCSAAHLLDFVPAGVNKGTGLLRCAELLGIDPAETAAIGDSENDISMLRAAGFSAAMGNASAEVRSEADMTVPSCDEDGLAWFIENVLL